METAPLSDVLSSCDPTARAERVATAREVRLLRGTAAAAAALFSLLLALSLAGGVSQQRFEHVFAPRDYAEALHAGATQMRVLVTIDDVFIVTYVAAGLLFATLLLRRGGGVLAIAAGAATVAAGVLDYAENHHLLALLAAAERGLDPPLGELVARESQSALKWMLAHAAFFLAGLVLPARDTVTRLLRFALLALQLPVGALAWTVVAPDWEPSVALARAACLLSGFVLIAWLAPRLAGDGGSGRGAPA